MLLPALRVYKEAYYGLSRNTWYLSLVMLINRSGTMVVPFMTVYCTQKLHFTISQAGFVMGVFGAGAIFGAMIGGRVTDRLGFYPQQVASLFLGGLMFIVTGFVRSFPVLCISTFVLSVFNESFRPANASAIAHYSTPENRTRSYSMNRLAINLGWAVGGALGGFLASLDYQLLFWVDGFTNIAAACLLLYVLPYAKTGSKHITTGTPVQKGAAYRDRVYLYFIALTITFATCFFLMFTLLPLFFKKEWLLSERYIGILMAVNGLIIVAIEMVVVYSLEGKRALHVLISTGIVLIGSGYVLLNIFPIAFVFAVISMVIITIGEILSMPFMNSFWISRSQPENRGQYAALYTIAWSIAQIIAPTVGGMVADHAGFTILWWSASALCGLTAIGFIFLGRRQRVH